MSEASFSWPTLYRRPPSADMQPNRKIFLDVEYSTPLGYRPILMDVYVPEGVEKPPVVLWVHGGGFHEGSRRHFPPTFEGVDIISALLSAGIAVAPIDYRLSHEAPFPAQVHDAKAAVRYLRRYASELGIDPNRIGAWGESAGGYIASMLGVTADGRDSRMEGREGVSSEITYVAAVVNWYGLTDLISMPPGDDLLEFLAQNGVDTNELTAEQRIPPLVAFLGDYPRHIPEAAAFASPVSHVQPGLPAFLSVHGTVDEVVPFQQAQILHERLIDAGSESTLIPIPNANHIFGGHDDIASVVRESVEFFVRQFYTQEAGTAE